MAHDRFTIYAAVPVPIKNRRGHREWGDIPVVTLNEVTGVLEPVVNTRGRAYASRNQLRYRNKKRD